MARIWPTPWAGYTMYSFSLNPCRCVAFTAGRCSTTAIAGAAALAAATGRVAVFFEVIPRGAPCRLGFAAGLCFAAPRTALRDDDAPRRLPAEVFLVALFFK